MTKTTGKSPARQAKLAAALKANLKKRKDQAKQRPLPHPPKDTRQ